MPGEDERVTNARVTREAILEAFIGERPEVWKAALLLGLVASDDAVLQLRRLIR